MHTLDRQSSAPALRFLARFFDNARQAYLRAHDQEPDTQEYLQLVKTRRALLSALGASSREDEHRVAALLKLFSPLTTSSVDTVSRSINAASVDRTVLQGLRAS
jgi:hypothetical protein